MQQIVDAPWDFGLDADAADRFLHHIFGPDPHPEYGGGMRWRCGNSSAKKSASRSKKGWCHAPKPDEEAATKGAVDKLIANFHAGINVGESQEM